MVRLVLFDIDGTLVRTGGAGVRAFRQVFATTFNALDGFDRLKFSGRTDLSLVREFFNQHGIEATKDNFERFFVPYAFWLDHILHQSESAICPGVLRFMDGLLAHPDPPVLGLLTGNIRLGAEIKLRHFGLWERFATGAFADDHEDRDQIAAIARARGNRLLGTSLRGEEIVVIGDTPLDIRCARAIGAKALAVATGGSPLEELRPHRPDWLVPDLTHLPPEAVLRSPTA